MLSLQQQQQQQNVNAHFIPMMTPMINPNANNDSVIDRSTVNSHQGLADKIQAVRHLWEPNENPSTINTVNLETSTLYPTSFLQYH